MKNKIIMVLGAGIGQVPAIQKANKMGITTIAVDQNPDAVGMSEANIAYITDITDLEGVLEIARAHNIDGAITLQSDVAIPVLGKVNGLLGLKNGISENVAIWCSNKIAGRQQFNEKKVSQPRFEVVKDLSSAEWATNKIGYPCVFKAPDSSGSRGIRKVSRKNQIKEAFTEAKKHTNGNAILVEEYIDGLEFGAQTFSQNGSCEKVLLHNDQLSSPPYMIPVGHSFPFKHLNTDSRDYAIEEIKKAVEALQIWEGPANVDLILEKETGQVKILEIGARIGATCLPELVENYTGIDWVSNAINIAVGKQTDLTMKREMPVAAQVIQAPADGIFKSYSFESPLSDYNIIEFEISLKPGDKVNKFRKGTDRIGKVLASGRSVEVAENNIKLFIDDLTIDLK